MKRAELQKGVAIADLALLSGEQFNLTQISRIIYGREDVYNTLKLRRTKDLLKRVGVVQIVEPSDRRTKQGRGADAEDFRYSQYKQNQVVDLWISHMRREFNLDLTATEVRIISSYILRHARVIFRYDQTMSFFHKQPALPSYVAFVNLSLLTHLSTVANLDVIHQQRQRAGHRPGKEQRQLREIQSALEQAYPDVADLMTAREDGLYDIWRPKRRKVEEFRYRAETSQALRIYSRLYRDTMGLVASPTTPATQRVRLLRKLFPDPQKPAQATPGESL